MLFYFFFLINAIYFLNHFSKYYYRIRGFCISIFDSNVIPSIKTDNLDSLYFTNFILIIVIIIFIGFYIFLHYKVTNNHQIIYDQQIYKKQIKRDLIKIIIYAILAGIILYSISTDIEMIIFVILFSILTFIIYLLYRLTNSIYISKFFSDFPIANNYYSFLCQLADDQKSKIILNYNEICEYDKYAYEVNKDLADNNDIFKKIFIFFLINIFLK